MTPLVVVTLEKHQLAGYFCDPDGKATQGNGTVRSINGQIVQPEKFTTDISQLLCHVHADEAGSTDDTQSHVARTSHWHVKSTAIQNLLS